jgi:hypothetical protein
MIAGPLDVNPDPATMWVESRSPLSVIGVGLREGFGGEIGGLKQKELGEQVGGLDYRTVSGAVDRFAKRAAAEKRLRGMLQRGRGKSQNPET